MKIVASTSVTRIPHESSAEDVIYDPPGYIGNTQEMFLSLTPQVVPLAKGVYRFKTHEEMNAQWDAVENEIVRLQQNNIKPRMCHE